LTIFELTFGALSQKQNFQIIFKKSRFKYRKTPCKSTNLVTKFVNEKIGILNFSNEEYKTYNELLETLEDFTMEHFEKIRAETGKNWQVNIGTLKTGILMHLGFLKSKEKKNIERALMPKVMEKAKELAGF